MPNKLKEPWQYNDQWNFYKAPGGPEKPPEPPVVPPQPTRYSDKAFLHSWTAGAFLPLLQAAITSLVIMAGTATFVWLIGGYEYVRPVVAAGVTTFVITWLALQFRWINLTKLEELTGLELDGRPGIGQQPQTGRMRIQVDEVKENGHIGVTKQFDLPASPAQLKAIAVGMRDYDLTLAQENWIPLKEGKPFSSQGIRDLQQAMLDHHIIVRANANGATQGFVETAWGRGVIDAWYALDEDISMWTLG